MADLIGRRSGRWAKKAGGTIYVFPPYTIYGVLPISLMQLFHFLCLDRSDHFVQHGERIFSRILFWRSCAGCNNVLGWLSWPDPANSLERVLRRAAGAAFV